MARLQPALLLSQQGALAGHFAMGVPVPSSGNGGLGTLELVRGGVGSLAACGAAPGSVLLGQTWFLGAGRVFLSRRGFGVIHPFPCEDGEDGGGCCENVLDFGNELG